MVFLTLLCVQAIPILSAFFMCHIPIFLFLIRRIFHLLAPLLLLIVGGILCCRFVCMCVSDRVVCKCVPAND